MTGQINYPTELVSRAYWGDKILPHARNPRHPVKNEDGLPCAMCGRTDFKVGFNTYETTLKSGHLGSVLSANFGEQFSLKEPFSPVCCPYCESVVRQEFQNANGVVASANSIHLIVGQGKEGRTSKTVNRILSGEVYKLMLDPPDDGPFIFAFNRDGIGKNGTHFVFLAPINYNRERYAISYLDEQIFVDRQFLLEVWERIVKKDPASNVMSTSALMAGIRGSLAEQAMLQREREYAEKHGIVPANSTMVDPKDKAKGKGKGKAKGKDAASKFVKGKSQKIYENSEFFSDPEFLRRALKHDNFRAMSLFFRSIASLNANNKKVKAAGGEEITE